MLSPEDVGLPPSRTHRRVAGLRREEVAILAGVSVDYYVKLEQGRAGGMSEPVLRAIEDALRLDDLERAHLRRLLAATGREPVAALPAAPRARAAVVSMVHALHPTPAIVHGPRLEVIALNHAAAVLFADFDAVPQAERNLARWMFLDPHAREVYLDWEQIAEQMVAILRAAAVPGVRDERLAVLVGELTLASPEFARMWADYRLFEHTHGVKRLHHEAVGEMRINFETLPLVGDGGQYVVVYTADRGSPSEEKLRLLASWTAPDAGADTDGLSRSATTR